jgi:hypothetical protein
MTFDVIEPSDIPDRLKALKENVAIYEAARKLLTLGVGRAMRTKVDRDSAEHIRKKAHVHFRYRAYRMRSKYVDGYFYMWIEQREPKRFDVVGVPANKTLAARA